MRVEERSTGTEMGDRKMYNYIPHTPMNTPRPRGVNESKRIQGGTNSEAVQLAG